MSQTTSTASAERPQSRLGRLWRGGFLAKAVGLFGALVTLLAFGVLWQSDVDKAMAEFRGNAGGQAAQLKHDLEHYGDIVLALRTFIAGNKGESVDNFENFASEWTRAFPGVRSLFWVPKVTSAQRAAYEAARSSRGEPTAIFEVDAAGVRRTAGVRETYYPIDRMFIAESGPGLTGFDLGSEPQRRSTMERAEDSGRPASTPVLTLLSRPEKKDGVLIFWPVYAAGASTATAEERRQALLGFAVGAFEITAMMRKVLELTEKPGDLAVQVFEGPSTDANLIYSSTTEPTPRREDWLVERQMIFGDRQWTVAVLPALGAYSTAPGRDVWVVLLLGAVGTAVAMYFAKVVADRSAELQRSLQAAAQEAAFSTVLIDSMPGLFALISEDGAVSRWNANLLSVTGKSEAELANHEAFSIIAPKDRAEAQRTLALAFEKGMQDIEFDVLAKDGTLRSTHWTGRRIVIDGRAQVVAVGIDMTEHKAAEAALAESKQLLEAVLNTTPVRLFWKDRNLVYLGCNAGFAADAGYSSPQDIVGKTDFDMGWRAQAELYQADDRRVVDTGIPKLMTEEPLTMPDGRIITLLTSKLPLRRPNGEIYGVLGAYTDISERKRSEDALRASEERFRAVSEAAQDAIVMTDSRGCVEYWNNAAERVFGYSAKEAAGRDVHRWLAPPEFRDRAAAGIAAFAATGRGEVVGKTVELTALHKSGRSFPVELSLAAMKLGDGWHAVAVTRDITERKRIEEEIRRMARRDFLTGLPNRIEFVDKINQEIARARRGAGNFAILYLDLDHFKDVNDTMGHIAGDLLLQYVGQRIKSAVRVTDTVARFGGDEFAVIVADIQEPAEVALVADKLISALEAPFRIQDAEVHTGASIGIAVFGPDGPDAETLLAHTDIALYRVKSEGRGSYRFFTESMDTEVRERVTMVSELREALEKEQFFLVYQPQIEVGSGRVTGIEALVRWQHPTRGVVLPQAFIETAEKSALIVPIGRWVLREACRQAKKWLDVGLAPPRVAVNLSGLQFKAPQMLEKEVEAALAETSLLPSLLELEITESVLMESTSEHQAVLLRLRKSGVRIAMDDFGTGYSSLSYLSEFPVDLIKIAQTFMVNLKARSGNAAIVKAAIGLANDLGLDVVVEGVETAEQLRMVTNWGGKKVQGYYFSRPLHAADMHRLLQENSSLLPAARNSG